MDDRTRKIIYVTLSIILGLFFFYMLADSFSPGSYPNAETYELAYPESQVIKVINQFKTENPNIAGPNYLADERIDGHWYKVYFYIQDEDKIVYTWTRNAGSSRTTFAFVSLNDGLTQGGWKDINRDFGFFENRRLKRILEERILSEIKKRLEKAEK